MSDANISLSCRQLSFYEKRCPLPLPAKYIRLVRLYASDDCTTPLQCAFQTCSIQNLPRYNALSYAWGSQDKTSSVSAHMLNDTSPQVLYADEEINITPSLETCLLHLRSSSEDLVLWIDQLCIDQANMAEKESQVLLMGYIYQAAELVIAWIGIESDGSDEVMRKWTKLGEIAIELGIDQAVENGKTHDLVKVVMSADDDGYTRDLNALLAKATAEFENIGEQVSHFSLRPWFRRIWIVQEISFAKTVVIRCGNQTADMQLLAVGMFVCILAKANNTSLGVSSVESKATQNNSYPLIKLMGSRNKMQHRMGRRAEVSRAFLQPLWYFLEFLNDSEGMEATDPRDRVFAILALASDGLKIGIRPDYGSTVEQVYTKTARATLTHGTEFSNGERGPCINFLRHCRAYEQEPLSELPSWVPDLRRPFQMSFYGRRLSAIDSGASLFNAGGPATPNEMVPPNDDTDENLICLMGYFIDAIETVGKPWLGMPQRSGPINRSVIQEGIWTPLIFLYEVKALCDIAIKKQIANPDIGDPSWEDWSNGLETAFWKVPCGDIATQPYGSDSQRTTPEWKEAYVTYLATLESGVAQDPELRSQLWEMATGRTEAEKQRLTQLGRNYYVRLMHMRKMRPFVTRKGYVGMVPMAAQVGDEVVVFAGGSTPFVVRAVGDGSNHNKLIGEAYCHSMMDGEALKYRRLAEILLI